MRVPKSHTVSSASNRWRSVASNEPPRNGLGASGIVTMTSGLAFQEAVVQDSPHL
jgi:hypothetical protein